MLPESANGAGDQSARHVYRLSRGRLLVLPLLWGVIASLLLAPLFGGNRPDPAETRVFLISLGIFTLILLPFFAIVFNSRLVLSAEGIAHHQFGYTVRSSWANLEALSLSPGSEALLLREPGTHSVLLHVSAKLLSFLGLGTGLGDQALEQLAGGRIILIAPFIEHWKNGCLRKDIGRWAPHLLDVSGPGAPPATPTPHDAAGET